MKHLLLALAASALLLPFNASLAAQAVPLNKAMRDSTIDRLVELLKAKYAYPEVAAKMEAELRRRQKRGDYDSLTDGDRFAQQITADLRGVFNDKHLELSFSATPIPVRSGMAGAPSAEEIERARVKQRRENFGAPRAEILKGNIGLLQLNYFAPLAWAADTYAAAMNYLANTDALIIDVQLNGGSMDINTIPYFCSYLFDQPVKLGDFVESGTNEVRQLWTYAQVPGKKYIGKPVFVLTSQRTGSGAESFVSDLKRLKRASLIGETTAGATMPGGSQRVNEHFSIWISTGRSSTGKPELENKGVVPDTATPAQGALNEAHRQALDQLIQNSSNPDWKAELVKVRSTLNVN